MSIFRSALSTMIALAVVLSNSYAFAQSADQRIRAIEIAKSKFAGFEKRVAQAGSVEHQRALVTQVAHNLATLNLNDYEGKVAKLNAQERADLDASVASLNELGQRYHAALQTEEGQKANPVDVARTLANESEQAGVFLVIGLIGLGVLGTLLVIGVILDDALRDACESSERC